MKLRKWSVSESKLRDNSSSIRLTKVGAVKNVINRDFSSSKRKARTQRGRVWPSAEVLEVSTLHVSEESKVTPSFYSVEDDVRSGGWRHHVYIAEFLGKRYTRQVVCESTKDSKRRWKVLHKMIWSHRLEYHGTVWQKLECRIREPTR